MAGMLAKNKRAAILFNTMVASRRMFASALSQMRVQFEDLVAPDAADEWLLKSVLAISAQPFDAPTELMKALTDKGVFVEFASILAELAQAAVREADAETRRRFAERAGLPLAFPLGDDAETLPFRRLKRKSTVLVHGTPDAVTAAIRALADGFSAAGLVTCHMALDSAQAVDDPPKRLRAPLKDWELAADSRPTFERRMADVFKARTPYLPDVLLCEDARRLVSPAYAGQPAASLVSNANRNAIPIRDAVAAVLVLGMPQDEPEASSEAFRSLATHCLPLAVLIDGEDLVFEGWVTVPVAAAAPAPVIIVPEHMEST